MALDDSFNKVLSEYLKSSDQALTQNPLAAYIRHKIPNEVSQMLGPQNRYIFQGSPGQGNWAAVPWVGIFDRLITTTAQKGYYLVYLFREDMGGLYLSLNQGITTVKAQYGSDAKTALKAM